MDVARIRTLKPYPFGTSLEVTPTLLRTPNSRGDPRVRLTVKAGRKSILPLQGLETELGEGSTIFENIDWAAPLQSGRSIPLNRLAVWRSGVRIWRVDDLPADIPGARPHARFHLDQVTGASSPLPHPLHPEQLSR